METFSSIPIKVKIYEVHAVWVCVTKWKSKNRKCWHCLHWGELRADNVIFLDYWTQKNWYLCTFHTIKLPELISMETNWADLPNNWLHDNTVSAHPVYDRFKHPSISGYFAGYPFKSGNTAKMQIALVWNLKKLLRLAWRPPWSTREVDCKNCHHKCFYIQTIPRQNELKYSWYIGIPDMFEKLIRIPYLW